MRLCRRFGINDSERWWGQVLAFDALIGNTDSTSSFDEEPWAFDELQMDTLALTLAEEANRTRAELSEALAKRDRKIAALREQVAELRGTVNALLGLRNGNTTPSRGESEVLDLPCNFWRRDAA